MAKEITAQKLYRIYRNVLDIKKELTDCENLNGDVIKAFHAALERLNKWLMAVAAEERIKEIEDENGKTDNNLDPEIIRFG